MDDLLAGGDVVTEETPAKLNEGIDAAGSVGGIAVNPGDEIRLDGIDVSLNEVRLSE